MTEGNRIAQTILARLGELRAGKLPADRRAIPLEQLEALARDYLSRAGTAGGGLAETGQVYVSLAAARAYGAAERIHGDETARRELTELLLDAKQTADGSWRARKRSTGLDVTARVVSEGRLLVVTSVSVRELNAGGRRG